jgi:hypothetical protein
VVGGQSRAIKHQLVFPAAQVYLSDPPHTVFRGVVVDLGLAVFAVLADDLHRRSADEFAILIERHLRRRGGRIYLDRVVAGRKCQLTCLAEVYKIYVARLSESETTGKKERDRGSRRCSYHFVFHVHFLLQMSSSQYDGALTRLVVIYGG